MNLLRDYFRITLRSPDDPAAPELELAPAADAPVEPVAADAPAPDAPIEPEPAPAPVVTAPPPMVPLRVMQERIGEEASKRQAAEERARSYEEIVKRLQAEPKPAVDPQNPPAPVTRTTVPTTIDQTAVQQEAARQLLQRDLANVSEAGFKAYGQPWNDAINALNAYGANTPEFVASVIEIDPAKTHEIMFEIAKDPEKAVTLAKMTPTRRVAEITRMVMAKTAVADKPAADPKVEPPKPTAISRAPAPKPAIAPHAPAPEVDPTTPEGNEKMTDAQWEQWYKGKHYKRSA